MIMAETETMEEVVVSGVTSIKNQAKISLLGVPDRPGIAARILKQIADAGINLDMIVQNVSEPERANLSFTVLQDDLQQALDVVRKTKDDIGALGIDYDSNLAQVSIIGIGMRSHVGIGARMFQALAEQNINIQMISTSEIKLSCIIDDIHAERAVRAIHDKFELGRA